MANIFYLLNPKSLKAILPSFILTIVIIFGPFDLTHGNSFEGYVEVSHGTGQLEDSSIVEGSSKYGGKQPNYLIDSSNEVFIPLFNYAKSLKMKKLTSMEKASLLRDFIARDIFPDRGKSVEYNRLNETYRSSGKPIPLSLLIQCKSGVCRENSYVMHLALREAGVPNKIQYVHLKSPDIDHGFISFESEGRQYIADSYYAALHAKEVTSVISDGLITKMNLFPNFHAPKEEWEAIKKPLSAIVTLQQLNELLSKKVKEIPDLKSTWDFAERNNIPLYIGGGIVRGLLIWISKNIQSNGFDGTIFKKVPSSKQLLILAGSDRDLYVDKQYHEQLRNFNPDLKTWELSPLRAHQSSVDGGGPSLEKVLISPAQIIDPFSALEDYRKGLLTYKDIPSEVIAKTLWFSERGNSKLAMALRYLRMSIDLPNLRIPEETRTTLIKQLAMEIPNLNEKHRIWIEKGLLKIYQASGNRLEVTLKLLKDYQILLPLAQKGFSFTFDLIFPIELNELKLLGFTPEEIIAAKAIYVEAKGRTLIDLKKIFNNRPPPEAVKRLLAHTKNFDQDREILNAAAPLMATVADFIEIFTQYKDLGNNYRKMLSEVMNNHINHFLSLGPTVHDARYLIDNISKDYTLDSKIARSTITLAKTPDEFIKLLGNNGDHKQRTYLAPVLMTSLNHLATLNPAIAEIRRVMSLSSSYDQDAQIAQHFVSLCKSPDDFIELFKPTQSNDENSRKKMDHAMKIMLKNFINLRPTVEQAQRLMREVSNTYDNDALIAFEVGTANQDLSQINRLFKTIYTGESGAKSQKLLSSAYNRLPHLGFLVVSGWLENSYEFPPTSDSFKEKLKSESIQNALLKVFENFDDNQMPSANQKLLFDVLASLQAPRDLAFADKLINSFFNRISTQVGAEVLNLAIKTGFSISVLKVLSRKSDLASSPYLIELIKKALPIAMKENPSFVIPLIGESIFQQPGMEDHLDLLSKLDNIELSFLYLKTATSIEGFSDSKKKMSFLFSSLIKLAEVEVDHPEILKVFPALLDSLSGEEKNRVLTILGSIDLKPFISAKENEFTKLKGKYLKLVKRIEKKPNLFVRAQILFGANKVIRTYDLIDRSGKIITITETVKGEFLIPDIKHLESFSLSDRISNPNILGTFKQPMDTLSCRQFY